MSVTDTERVNYFDRRVVGAVDLDDRHLTFVEDFTKRIAKTLLTGSTPTTDQGGFLVAVTVVDGSGLNDLTFSAMYGTPGDGTIISVDALDSRLVDVPFEDTAAVIYYMAAKTAFQPVGLEYDTETGQSNYDYEIAQLGHRAEPTVVVDGGGFITLTLGNHALIGSDDFTGRTAVVFLKTPVATDAATAIETVTITGQTATTVGTLGQSTVSTTASDYEVVIVGPTISRWNGLVTAAGWAFVGVVVGGGSPRVFDFSSQILLPTPTSLLAAFSVEHDFATGEHTSINADDITVLGSGFIDITGLVSLGSNSVFTDIQVLGTSLLEDEVTLLKSITLDPTTVDENAYKYDAGQPDTLHVGVSPVAGGWVEVDALANIDYQYTATPPHVQSTSVGNAIRIHKNLGDVLPQSENRSTTAYTLTAVRTIYDRNAAADAVVVSMRKALRDGTGAPVTVFSSAKAITAGTFTLSTDVISEAVDPLYDYWLDIFIDPNAGAANARVASVEIEFEKIRLE